MVSNLCRCGILWCVIHGVWSQGSAQLMFSSNPVYSQELVTLTCSWVTGFSLIDVTINAFNATPETGSLQCSAAAPNCTPVTGVLNAATPIGWPIPLGAWSIKLMFTATPLLELNYSCAARIANASNLYTVASERAFLQVLVYPSPPRFQLSPIVFNDSDSGNITCESRNGTPPAALLLMVSDSSGILRSTENGIVRKWVDLSFLEVPLWKWHGATVTCRVTNHNSSNMTVTNVVRINYITNTSDPGVIYKNESVILNCSAYISFYPGVFYNWTVPPAANVTDSLDLERITVPQGQFGSFYCTAANNVTMASVVIVFTVSNLSRPSVPGNQGGRECGLCWIIGLILGIIAVVIITVILGVLCKRGHFSKGKKKPGVKPSGSDQRADDGSNRVRLLIAGEGVVNQLSLRALHTTAVVEFSHRSCSLNDILEKVKQAVPGSSSKFKSVALLLHPAKIGVTLSDVDQAELNSSSIQKEKGEKVRAFMMRLAEICLDERGGARVDVLNYNGKAPVRLSEALTSLLGIPATVSRDHFGVGTPTDDKGGHAFVANDYFDVNNLGEVVYAELQQPSVKPHTQPRPSDERVIYSEIKR